MAKIDIMCVNATCKFEVAMMFFVFISWIYTVIITLGIRPFSPIGFAWIGLFIISIYWLFKKKQELKKFQTKVCK